MCLLLNILYKKNIIKNVTGNKVSLGIFKHTHLYSQGTRKSFWYFIRSESLQIISFLSYNCYDKYQATREVDQGKSIDTRYIFMNAQTRTTALTQNELFVTLVFTGRPQLNYVRWDMMRTMRAWGAGDDRRIIIIKREGRYTDSFTVCVCKKTPDIHLFVPRCDTLWDSSFTQRGRFCDGGFR